MAPPGVTPLSGGVYQSRGLERLLQSCFSTPLRVERFGEHGLQVLRGGDADGDVRVEALARLFGNVAALGRGQSLLPTTRSGGMP
jgi:hypothetical protein